MYKLGKKPAAVDRRTLKLARYMPVTLPPLPDKARWDQVKDRDAWGMDGNDTFGNCVVVTAAHILDCARAVESSQLLRISDQDVIKTTHEVGAEDGYVVLNRLKIWRRQGLFGSRIEAFASVDHNHEHIRAAINIFGHADIGLLMPVAWQNTNVWDVGSGDEYEKGSWGGHSVPILGYEAHGNVIFYYVCTWGRIVMMTKEALDAYCDEIYVSIVPDWYANDQLTPSGFKVEELIKDAQALS